MPWPFQISDLAITDQEWTPVVTPFACNSVAVKNTLSDAIKVKTDDAEDTLAAGSQEAVMSHFSGVIAPEGYSRRFRSGSTVMLLKATSGSGTVKVRFLY